MTNIQDTVKKAIELNPHLDAWFKDARENAKSVVERAEECEKMDDDLKQSYANLNLIFNKFEL